MTAPLHEVSARAPAKINLSLRVGPLRPDGYHTLATVFHAVDLDDVVTATAVTGDAVSVEVVDERGADVPGVPRDESNLAVRAAMLVRAEAGMPGRGVHLTVRKSIPVAGGMAGGSADAAAALVACGALWETGFDRDRLVPLAARLGSDVPFALFGGTAVGTGRGERIEPVSAPHPLHWIVARSTAGLSTPEVYAALDRLRADAEVAGPRIDARLVGVLERGLVGALGLLADNDLEPAVLALRPELRQSLDGGRRAGALAAMVSGSGPSLVFLVDPRRAATVAREVARRPGVADVRHAIGPAPGAGLVR